MKYQVVERLKFVAGSMEGLDIEHRSGIRLFDDERAAYKEANDRRGKDGGGYGFGSPYIVLDAWVVEVDES